MDLGRQTTLRREIFLGGIGVHSNVFARVKLQPARANTGIVFQRIKLNGTKSPPVRAHWSEVSMTQLCTVIGSDSASSISTIEHILAACVGLGLDNIHIEIDGPEIPILDGSAAPFVKAIEEVGLVTLAAPRRYLKIREKIRIKEGDSTSELLPLERGFHLDVEIDFKAPIIGRQRLKMELTPTRFKKDLCAARTFGFLKDLEPLTKAGFALGASMENSIALEDTRVLNPEGLRYPDECVRHKMLDAIGDLALAGAPIIGIYRSYCGGHRMNAAILKALFSQPSTFEYVTVLSTESSGVQPYGQEHAFASAF